MLTKVIKKLVQKENLSAVEVEQTLEYIISGCDEAQVSDFLLLLRAKGETSDEIYGVVKTMRKKMKKITCDFPVLDIVGTGGDGFNTVNISTASALLAASCGVKIIKHGNRSVSSLCGSADVLEALGININAGTEKILETVEKYNFGFCYAPNFHLAMSKVKEIRKKLNTPTVFNLVGPLLNPASAEFLMVGVGDSHYLKPMAEVLVKLNVKRALIFNCCGLDEICTVGKTKTYELNEEKISDYEFDATHYGFKPCRIEDLQGGNANINAELLKSALKGMPGAVSDALVLNAGFACYLYGLVENLNDGFDLAKRNLEMGSAYALLETLREE